jgi:hypothetical protein
MTYYIPMKLGKTAIDVYYQEHENPNAGIDDEYVRATRIIDIAKYMTVDSYYKVVARG